MDAATESDAELLWVEVVEQLEDSELPASVTAMLRSCEPVALTEAELRVQTSSRFVLRMLSRHMETINAMASEVAFSPMTVVIEVGEPGPAKTRILPPEPPAPRPVEVKPEPVISINTQPRDNPLIEEVTHVDSLLTFDRFVEGPQNKFAFDAAKQVANGNHNYNPLFIYGKSGLGKTHLLRAIQNYLAKNDPERSCVYRVATDFIDDYSKAMKNARAGAAEALANNYHAIDVLIIDDVQLMSTAAGTIGFFFDTFNYLTGHGKQIVLAADRTPTELGLGQSRFDERVTSRLDSGMTVSIQVPDYELKLHLIDAFYERMRLDAREQHVPGIDAEIAPDLRKLMAERAGTNIRVIESFVQSCLMTAFQHSAVQQDLTEGDIIRIAEQKWPTGQRRVTCEQIQEYVAQSYGITLEDLVGAKRNKELMEPRHVAIWLTRELTDATLADIGKQFGGRTHATIKHSISVIENATSEDRVLGERISRIRDQVLEV